MVTKFKTWKVNASKDIISVETKFEDKAMITVLLHL